nr:hypothetical protein [Tanacetum cinerariifolium]
YTKIDINHAAGRDLRRLSAEEAWETIEDYAQCDKEWKTPTSTISDQTISNLKAQLVKNEVVRLMIPKCMSWLDAYDELVEKLEETIGIPMEVEPLDHMKLENLGLNTNTHDLFLSSKGFHSVDEPVPQLLPKFSPLDVNLGDKRGTDPPSNPYSSDSFRMKVVKPLTIHTPPSPHVHTSIEKVKGKQEKDKIETKPDKNGKRGKARECQISVTIKIEEKTKKIQTQGTNTGNS